MTWSETWRQAQRKRTLQWFLALLVPLVALPSCLVVVAWFLFKDRDSATLIVMGGAFESGVVLVAALLTGRRYLAERRTLRLVPEHDGLVCLKCRQPLSNAGVCSACGRAYSPEAVRHYWEQYPQPNAAQPDVGVGPLPLDKRIELVLQRHPWRAGVVVVGIWMAMCLMVALTEGSVLVATVRWFPMLCFMMGMLLVGLARGVREGAVAYCAQCDYERGPGSHGDRCPECGSDWTQRGGLTRGRSAPRPKLLWIGMALASVYLATVCWSWFAGRAATVSVIPTWLMLEQVEGRQRIGRSNHDVWADLAARPLDPIQSDRLTWLLIEEVVAAPRGFVSDEWLVLGQRALTQEQRERLFEGLLDKHRDKGYLSRGDVPWIDAAVESGSVSKPLLDRYRREIRRMPERKVDDAP